MKKLTKNKSRSLQIRIWSLQLCHNFREWNDFECSVDGNVRNRFCDSRITMWFKIEYEWKRNSRCCIILWHHLFITFMGLSCGYKRSKIGNTANTICGIPFIHRFFIRSKFLSFCCTTIPQWIFVSLYFLNILYTF